MAYVGTAQARSQTLRVTVDDDCVTVDVSDDLGDRTCHFRNRVARDLGTALQEAGGGQIFLCDDGGLEIFWLPDEKVVVWLFFTEGHLPLFLYRTSVAEAKALGFTILAEVKP